MTAPELSRDPLSRIRCRRTRRSAEPKNAYTGGCADIDSPIGDSWSYELIACPKMVTPRGCLIAIIELRAKLPASQAWSEQPQPYSPQPRQYRWLFRSLKYLVSLLLNWVFGSLIFSDQRSAIRRCCRHLFPGRLRECQLDLQIPLHQLLRFADAQASCDASTLRNPRF
jgi:hypothetical protein